MYDTTPTNELIDQAAELYAHAMTALHIVGQVIITTTGSPRRSVFLMDDHCEAVQGAALFWHEAIAAPLAEAHVAAHDLMGVTLARKEVNAPPNSPHEIAARSVIKRLRLTMAESEAAIRREMEKVLQNPTMYL